MKKNLLFTSLLTLVLSVSSCDQNNMLTPQPQSKVLSVPAQVKSTAKYFSIAKKDAQNAAALESLAEELIFTFGEDGKVWVFSKGRRLSPQSAPCLNPKIQLGRPSPEAAQWYVMASTYTQPTAEQYSIEGWGTFTTSSTEADTQVSLQVTGKAPVSVSAQSDAAPIEATEATRLLGRSWVIKQTKIEVSGGTLTDTYGKVFKGANASDLPLIATDLDNVKDGGDLKMAQALKDNERWTRIREVVLSQAGLLSIFYENGKVDVANIEKLALNENIAPTWINEKFSQYLFSGDNGVFATIKDNFLVLTLNSQVSEVVGSKPYHVKFELVLEWAKG